jgi:hypothetical protein
MAWLAAWLVSWRLSYDDCAIGVVMIRLEMIFNNKPYFFLSKKELTTDNRSELLKLNEAIKSHGWGSFNYAPRKGRYLLCPLASWGDEQ